MINLKPVTGHKDHLELIDQTKLPAEEVIVRLTELEDIADAIKRLVVRGAPAIGIAAAYGLSVYVNPSKDLNELKNRFKKGYDVLAATRPTAVNLFWALDKMKNKFEALLNNSQRIDTIKEELYKLACFIEEEDYEMCRKIGEYGYSLMPAQGKVNAMTICNAGGFATSGFGTALAPFYTAKERGRDIAVFPLETRPLLQGSRLTAYELLKAGIKTTLLTDNMAGFFMKKESVDLIIVGADRIASNGDTANKIGTYQLAVLAKKHEIPFYVAAPYSTFDFSLKSGDEIPIEFRAKEEMTHFAGSQSAPLDVEVFSPAFDVTDNDLIAGIITDKGVFYPPYQFSAQSFK